MVEKSKKWAIVVVGLLLIAVIASAGCIGDKTTEEGEEAPTGEGTTPTAETPTAAPGDEGTSLSDLLGKAKGISVKYDMVITWGGTEPMTTKVWSTESKDRVESTIMGHTSITIVDKEAQVMYDYNPDQNTAVRMDFSDAETPGPQSFSEVMEQYNPTVVDTETVDGKRCTVIEYDVTMEDGTSVAQKMWVWQEFGFPIRLEMTASITGTPVTTVMEMKNIEFGPIDDSVFKLPDDVVITEMPSGVPSMPGGMQ